MSRNISPAGEHTFPDAARSPAARFANPHGAASERQGGVGSDPAAVQTSSAGGSATRGEPPAGLPTPPRPPDAGSPATTGTARRRIPELAIGIVLTGLGAIGALMLAGREEPRVPVLVWANDVTRGQVVEADDLRTAGIHSDSPVDVVSLTAAADVVGRKVAFDANAGGFVSGAVLDDGAVIPSGFAVVGLRLGPGRYPVGTLAAGDVVDLLTTEPMLGWDDPVVVSGVQVFDVLWLGGGEGGDALVSLLVPRTAAARVVASVDAGPRLAEVAP